MKQIQATECECVPNEPGVTGSSTEGSVSTRLGEIAASEVEGIICIYCCCHGQPLLHMLYRCFRRKASNTVSGTIARQVDQRKCER
jgi:hypothetical protein